MPKYLYVSLVLVVLVVLLLLLLLLLLGYYNIGGIYVFIGGVFLDGRFIGLFGCIYISTNIYCVCVCVFVCLNLLLLLLFLNDTNEKIHCQEGKHNTHIHPQPQHK
jgi:hypothetical protein